MDRSRFTRHGGARWVALPAVAALLLAAGGAAIAQSPAPGASGGAAEPLDLAYLSFAVANSYDAPMQDAAQAAAAAAGRDPHRLRRQQRPCRTDPTAAGRGRVRQVRRHRGPADLRWRPGHRRPGRHLPGRHGRQYRPDPGRGLHHRRFAGGRPVGRTSCSCPAIWAPRSASSWCRHAPTAADPCEVGYIYSVKASGLDSALRTAFDTAIAAKPGISVVAEGESFYRSGTRPQGRPGHPPAHPDIDVIVGADQAVTGALGHPGLGQGPTRGLWRWRGRAPGHRRRVTGSRP